MQALSACLEAGKMREAQLTADLKQVRQQLMETTEALQQQSQALAGAETSVADSQYERNKLLEVSYAEVVQHCIVEAISNASFTQATPRKQMRK